MKTYRVEEEIVDAKKSVDRLIDNIRMAVDKGSYLSAHHYSQSLVETLSTLRTLEYVKTWGNL